MCLAPRGAMSGDLGWAVGRQGRGRWDKRAIPTFFCVHPLPHLNPPSSSRLSVAHTWRGPVGAAERTQEA